MGDLLSALADIFTSEVTYSNAAIFAAILLFAASGEFVAEKAGTINISVEGMLLAGGFAAAVGYHLAQAHFASIATLVGLLTGALAGVVVGFVHANMSHRLPADQFVVGLVLNVLVLGLVGFLTGEIEPHSTVADRVAVPLLSDVPLIGRALFEQPWPFYLVYPVVPIVWWLVYRRRWGLEVRAIGEDPQAADVSGLHVNKRRRQTLYLVGLTSGLGGGYFLFASAGLFEDSMIGGRGIIALAAVIFGGWTLKGTVAGCILFGTVSSFTLSIPALGHSALPREFLAMAPNVVTIAGMAVFAKRVRQPTALARPFVRGLK
jgi:simple sugar transport system permease protein